MTMEDAVAVLARAILKKGESTMEGDICIKPDSPKDHHVFMVENQVTHFDVQWEIEGELVTVNLYRGGSFGAVEITGEHHWRSFLVNLETGDVQED